MTHATTAQGEMLFVKLEGVWTKIQELKSTPEIGESAEKIDATTLESEVKEYTKDIPDQSELSYTFNAMPLDVEGSNLALLMGMSKNGTYEFKQVLPRLGVQVIWTAGYTYRIGAGEVSTVKDLYLTLIPKTAPIITNISATFTVTYNANGGTGSAPTDGTTYNSGATVTAKDNTFTNTDKRFVFWNTKPDNSGISYDEGDTFSIYQNTTLYAIWSD